MDPTLGHFGHEWYSSEDSDDDSDWNKKNKHDSNSVAVIVEFQWRNWLRKSIYMFIDHCFITRNMRVS